MTNYYLSENGIIIQFSNWRFDENCLETEEEIIRDEFSGQLYLQSDYDALVLTNEYGEKVIAEQNKARKAELTAQIKDLDLKRIRAGFEPSVKDETTGETYLEYYTNQIIAIRNEISNL